MSGPEVRTAGPEQWATWRALRLRALQTDPEAFGSTYAQMIARDSEDYWRGVLAAPGRCFLARIAGAAIGMARVLPAPLERTADAADGADGADGADAAPPVAEVISVWVDPQARGAGAGRALVTACVDWARRHLPGAAVRLHVVETNTAARRLYESCGFRAVGREGRELVLELPAAGADHDMVSSVP